MKTIQLKISGMKCGGCVQTVERILQNSGELENISVNLLTESAYFDTKNYTLEISEILSDLSENGFPAEIHNDDFAERINRAEIEKESLVKSMEKT